MPVIEEINDDDIDQQHLSLEEFDPHNPFSRSMPVEEGAPAQLRPTDSRPSSNTNANSVPSSLTPSSTPGVGSFSNSNNNISSLPTNTTATADSLPEHMQNWTRLYPIYFDQTKSRSQGRRVDYSIACPNPLVTTLCDACAMCGFKVGAELDKKHPQDWSNPGRVRIDLNGRNKKEAMRQIAKTLKTIEVTPQSAQENFYKSRMPFDSLTPKASLRNEKLHKILPGNSPALSAKETIKSSMGDMGSMFGM